MVAIGNATPTTCKILFCCLVPHVQFMYEGGLKSPHIWRTLEREDGGGDKDKVQELPGKACDKSSKLLKYKTAI